MSTHDGMSQMRTGLTSIYCGMKQKDVEYRRRFVHMYGVMHEVAKWVEFTTNSKVEFDPATVSNSYLTYFDADLSS